MSIRILALAAASLALSVTSASAQELAVIKAGSALHRAPSANSAKLVLPDDDAMVATVLQDQGGWLEVHVNAEVPWENHCVDRPWELGAVTLRGWVSKTRLHDVAKTRITEKHADGTAVTVQPGAPILTTKTGTVARVDDLDWPVSPAKNQVGQTFKPAPLKQGKGQSQVASGELLIGGKPIGGSDGEYFTVTNVIDRDDKTTSRITSRCVHAVVAGKLETPPDGAGGLGMLGGLFGGTEHRKIRKGATAYWPDGEPAGYFHRETTISGATAQKDKGRHCGDFGRSDYELSVCFDDADGPPQMAIGNSFDLGSVLAKEPDDVTVSPNVVRRLLRQRRAELLACRALIAQTDRAAVDAVELEFEVLSTGRVANAVATSSGPANDAAIDCLTTALGQFVFPARSKATEVKHRLVFEELE